MHSGAGDDLCDNRIAHPTAVAVLIGGNAVGAGRDDERRVRDDVVELLPRDRLEHVAQAKFDRRDAVERGIESRIVQRGLRDVCRDHAAAEAAGMERLDAASGPEIERDAG